MSSLASALLSSRMIQNWAFRMRSFASSLNLDLAATIAVREISRGLVYELDGGIKRHTIPLRFTAGLLAKVPSSDLCLVCVVARDFGVGWCAGSVDVDGVVVCVVRAWSDRRGLRAEQDGCQLHQQRHQLADLSRGQPASGPAYPLPAPGVRLRVKPRGDLAFQAGIYSGTPAAAAARTCRVRCRPVRSSAFAAVPLIGEASYLPNLGKDAWGLPGAYRIGTWYHTSSGFADQPTHGSSVCEIAGRQRYNVER